MKHGLKRGEVAKLRRIAENMHMDDRDYRRASNYDFFIYLMLVFLVAFSVRTFIGEPLRVDGDSMWPTLQDGERMIVDRAAYYVKEPERGDIIICYYPGYDVSCVKRVVGLPGDYVLIEDGKIYINGNEIDEGEYWRGDIRLGMQGRVVKYNHVFVVGDNRNYSLDSRSMDIGDIPYQKIVGKVVFIMWPPGEMRVVEHVDFPEYTWDPDNPDTVYISEWERLEEEEARKEAEKE